MHDIDARTTGRAIAVVGAACRLPGGIDGLDRLWDALRQGRDVVGEIPGDRFESSRFVDTATPRAGKSYTAAGAFLDDVTGFDAAYFGIAPKEASRMDPQHRLLMELAVEALDDAGIAPERLAGTDAAVYVGVSDASYGGLQMMAPESVNAYTMSGAASSIAANRLSHYFDLRGPSMAVDTACSSSLVALDRACRTLLDGSSRVALSAGVNVLLSPYHYVGFSQAAMLSPSGRCASFSAAADGFVRAEGGGLVVLKKLADAMADGDRIHGVVLASASNSDGRTMGLALPNPDAQEDLLRSVYDHAGVSPDELVYLEAHGTGTLVGDPLECRAIGGALGRRRTTGVLPIGSVKTNIGHLEPASGIAGLLKALLVLRHRTIPPSLHASPPNPDIDFAALNLLTADDTMPLGPVERPVVGVNSFGFGGSNAHVVLTAAPAMSAPRREEPGPRPTAQDVRALPVMVSARTPKALAEAATRMADRLAAATAQEFYDIAYTTCLRRGAHPHRAVVLAGPRTAAQRLRALALGGPTPPADGKGPSGTASSADAADQSPFIPPPREADEQGRAVATASQAVSRGRIAFVFSGNGSQWPGMAADLLTESSVFREAVAEVDAALAPRLGWSVTDELSAPAQRSRSALTEVAQPLLFAVQIGLVRMLQAQGITPHGVLGHSVGEVAAAHVAGALDLAQAAHVIVERGRTQATTAGTGRMAAVALPADEAAKEAAVFPGVEVAAVNSGQDVTVAGPTDVLRAFLAELTRKGVACKELDLDHAFHSAAMDPIERPMRRGLSELRPTTAQLPMFSSVTGDRIEGSGLDGAYWWRNVREPVRFADATQKALEDGADVFVEIGPHPVLHAYLHRVAHSRTRDPVAVTPTLRRDVAGSDAMDHAVATLMAQGAEPRWDVYFPRPGRVVDLPAYPWQRERHWNGTPQTWLRTSGSGRLDHPLLGERLPSPVPTWEGAIEPALAPWLADHRLAGSVVVPATAYVEMAMAAGRLTLDGPAEVDCLEITRPLVVPWADAGGVRVQLAVTPDDGLVSITSTDARSARPRAHVRARVRALLGRAPADIDLAAVRARCPRVVDGAQHYDTVGRAGLQYGPAFQVLRELRVGDGEVLATYLHEAPSQEYEAHPALLDGALQAGAPLIGAAVEDGTVFLPAAVGSARVWRAPASRGWVHVRRRSLSTAETCWDITVTDDDGRVCVELLRCRLRKLAGAHRTALTTHHTTMRAAPDPGPWSGDDGPPVNPRQIVSAAADRIAACRADWHEAGYGRFIALFKKAAAHRYAAAVAALVPDPGAAFGIDDLVSAGMEPKRVPFAETMYPEMIRHGLAEEAGEGRLRLTRSRFEGTELLRELSREFPRYSTECRLAISRTQDCLAPDRGDPTDRAASGRSLADLTDFTDLTDLEQLYDTAVISRFHNRLAQALLRETVRAWPADRPLRVLEVGAGTGGMAAAVLPLLPAERTRYVYSDVSAGFLGRAERRFAAYDFVTYRTFDLDADPAGQGLPEAGFDVVIAANALHTAKDLEAAVGRVASLLTPGGMLLVLESHDMHVLSPYFGTVDAFWDHTDHDERPGSPLLPSERWPDLLTRCGFVDVVRTGDDAPECRDDFSVLLAATPRRALAPPALPTAPAGRHRVIAAETAGEVALARAVADLLPSAADGTRASVHAPDEGAVDWAGVLGTEGADVCVLLGDAPGDEPAGAVALTTRRAALLRALSGACAALDGTASVSLTLVTRPSGALPHPERPEATHDAAVWGIARTLANEEPRLSLRAVSLDRSGETATDARRVARELLAEDTETEVVLTAGGGRFVPRERELPAARTEETAGGEASFGLEVRSPGLSYQLAWVENTPLPAGPGQVAVAVRAAALNYRDMMQAVGLLPAEAIEGTYTEVGLGLECAGVVTAVGPDVTGFRPGDRVYGLAPASLASHTLTAAQALGHMPEGMSFTEAATLPVVFSTVHYSLDHLARLSAGETVLVHGGAGGIGLAVLQYAHRCGARVIATAGTPAKRELLRILGAEHVLDSRSLDFAVRVMEVTDGRGVDVVVNSLAGEAITRGLELLCPGGRFIELGKRDIYENKPLLLRPFRNNISFFGVDLTTLAFDPDRGARLFADVTERVRDRSYRPLPHSVYPAARVSEAFQLMQHSRHVGKVVVAMDPLDEPVPVERRTQAPSLGPGGTYLVTGGLSGFGAATAAWLAERGARHLALMSRRGDASPEAATVLARLAERGVRATAYAADVTDTSAVREVLARIDSGSHPLRGVVHCAMHLEDDLLTELTDERFAAALAPKVAGAAVLDQLLGDRELDLFLLYSSGTAFIGNVRQANYAAANLWLEALARRRRRSGAAGQAIAWGAIGETGYVARTGLTGALTSVGIEAVAPREAFAAAERLAAPGPEVVGVGRYNWARLRNLLPALAAPRCATLLPEHMDGADHSREEIVAALAAMEPRDAVRAVAETLARLLAGVLHMDEQDLDHDRRLDEYGLDSLMLAEMLVSLRTRFDIDIPPLELLRSGGTITDISHLVLLRLGLTGSPSAAAGSAEPAEADSVSRV